MTLLSVSTLCSRRWCSSATTPTARREPSSRLKVIDGDELQPLSGPITIGRKLHLTREEWEARQSDEKKGEASLSTGGCKRGKSDKARGGAQARKRGRGEGSTYRGGHSGTVDNQKLARDDVFHNCGTLGHWAKERRQSRRGQTHVAQVEEEEPALLLAHASIKLSPVASTVMALLHLDEPRAHTLLGNGSSNDKTDGWCLDTGATHQMTGRREFFTELDSDVRGSVKFRNASDAEIKGIGSVIFAIEFGEHKLLTGVYYIPMLRNTTISLGQLNEGGSRVEIKDGVMRIWDHHRHLLAKVTRGTNRLYVLNMQIAQPLCLAAHRDDEAWQ
jgi:hypothetical protein